MGWYDRKEDVIICDGPCGRELPRQNFNAENQEAWRVCNECLGYKPGKDERELTQCHGACGQMLPDYHFVDDMLQAWRSKNALAEAKCARCVVRERKGADKIIGKCSDARCAKPKCLWEFQASEVKGVLNNLRQTPRGKCYECSHPPCAWQGWVFWQLFVGLLEFGPKFLFQLLGQ